MKITTKLAYWLFPPHFWSILTNEWHLFLVRIQSPKKLNADGKFHFGCGERYMEGWLNIDYSKKVKTDCRLDVRYPLPFNDESAEKIYHEHLLEHIRYPEAIAFLREQYRILKKGGRIRIGVPDVDIYINAYKNGDEDFFQLTRHLGGAKEPLETPVRVINQMFRMGDSHQFAWDFCTLKMILERLGFINIRRYASGESSDESLILDDPVHEFETMYIEAEKI